MMLMMGICKDDNCNTVGFRLIDTNTMEIMDATYRSVFNAIYNNGVIVENLYIEDGKIEECGERWDYT